MKSKIRYIGELKLYPIYIIIDIISTVGFIIFLYQLIQSRRIMEKQMIFVICVCVLGLIAFTLFTIQAVNEFKKQKYIRDTLMETGQQSEGNFVDIKEVEVEKYSAQEGHTRYYYEYYAYIEYHDVFKDEAIRVLTPQLNKKPDINCLCRVYYKADGSFYVKFYS